MCITARAQRTGTTSSRARGPPAVWRGLRRGQASVPAGERGEKTAFKARLHANKKSRRDLSLRHLAEGRHVRGTCSGACRGKIVHWMSRRLGTRYRSIKQAGGRTTYKLKSLPPRDPRNLAYLRTDEQSVWLEASFRGGVCERTTRRLALCAYLLTLAVRTKRRETWG